MTAEALLERLYDSTLASLELFSVHIGATLGLYRELVAGPIQPAELARRLGIDPDYVAAWCQQQVGAGFVEEDERGFSVRPDHAEVLAGAEGAGPLVPLVIGIARGLPRLLEPPA